MNPNRKIAIIVGVLFIIATVATLVSYLFFNYIYEPDYLTVVATNENQVLIGVLFMLTATASIVGIPVALFSILKKYNERLALGYVGARIFEGLFFTINIITLLSILSLSHEFVNAAAPNISYFETSGSLLLAKFEWTSILLDFPFALSALIVNYLFYKSKVIPRWLSGWGIIGGILFLPGILLGMFNLNDPTLLFGLLGLQEMGLAAWLIIKGFNTSAIDS
jgi:hypothetical protein